METWDIYTKDRLKTHNTMQRGEPMGEGQYRLVVHVCLFNEKGEMLIQQRQTFKQGWPNLWDVSVGGHALVGESSEDAAQRELFEELGIVRSLQSVRPALTIHFKEGFDDYYLLPYDGDLNALVLQEEEVQAVRFASLTQIERMIAEGRFIPYHKSFIELLFAMRHQVGVHQ
ncbi:MAG: NUDIX hydrolase [Erysipelotrichaceae bacterium]